MKPYIERRGVTALAAISASATVVFGQPCDSHWEAMGSGVNSVVRAMLLYDEDQSGPGQPVLVVGGGFATAGGMTVNRIARWSGSAWSGMNLGFNSTVSALALFDQDGGGPNPPSLFAAGFFTLADGLPARLVARWTGSGWVQVGNGLGFFSDETVTSLAVFDGDADGPNPPELYAGGFFTDANGNEVDVARWNGSAWQEVSGGTNGTVTALFVFDPDASGPLEPVLLVGGLFSRAGTQTVRNLAQWDGETWAAFGGGVDSAMGDFALYDGDGPGGADPLLIAAGSFAEIGGVPVSNIASWNGTTWSALGSGTDLGVGTVAVFDEDGPGPSPELLYAGGSFTTAGGQIVNQIAAWDGVNWSGLDGGTNSLVSAVFAAPNGLNGSPPTLFAGGFFSTAGTESVSRIAAWTGCAVTPCPGDVNGDRIVDLADLTILLANFGNNAAGPDDGDLDGNSSVDLTDLALLLGQFGSTCR